MAIVAQTSSLTEPMDLAAGLARRVFRLFKAQVEDWHDGCGQLSTWEEENLLDHPAPEKLAEHSQILDALEGFGRWFLLATQTEGFPDGATAELVAMTIQDLKDRRALWHGKLKPEQRKEILHTVFNES